MAADQFDTGVLTLMFTDVVGSTDLTHRVGDEIARQAIESHRRIVREAIAKHGGREIDSIGDGFMIAFLSTRQAIICAVEIHRALEEHGREHPAEDLRVRIGLNVGEVLERGGHPFGAAVNATQRVAGHAKGAQVPLPGRPRGATSQRPSSVEPWGFEHTWHSPVHAVSQQTPSTQCPVLHSLEVVQPAPCLLPHRPVGPQLCPVPVHPAGSSASTMGVHTPSLVPAPQVEHGPQPKCSQHTPATQNPVSQSEPCTQAPPRA
jgi:hypothetical protein